jgi:hypothetical protein
MCTDAGGDSRMTVATSTQASEKHTTIASHTGT